ncbi:MAG: hypothetical protein QW727_03980 [Candidatus Pacearchaeota archaeon]
MRTEIEYIKNNSENLEKISGEIYYISILLNKILNCCISKKNEEKNIFSLLEAKTYFESCLTSLKLIIEPNNNSMINKINQEYYSYDAIEKYCGLFLTILDSEQKELERFAQETRRLVNPIMVSIAIKSFREKLIDYTINLIIMPLYNSIKTYQILSYTMSEKEKRENFEYILFRHVFISSKLKGSQDRQKAKIASQSMGASFKETNITKIGRGKSNEDIPVESIKSPPEINSEKFYEIFKHKYNEDEEDEDIEFD